MKKRVEEAILQWLSGQLSMDELFDAINVIYFTFCFKLFLIGIVLSFLIAIFI